jgi:hypothetical protein
LKTRFSGLRVDGIREVRYALQRKLDKWSEAAIAETLETGMTATA